MTAYRPIALKSRTPRPKLLYISTFCAPHAPPMPEGFLRCYTEHGGRFWKDGVEDSFYVGGYHGEVKEIDLAKAEACARTLPSGSLWVIDPEERHQSVDAAIVGPEAAENNKRMYHQWAAAMRRGSETITLGMYSNFVEFRRDMLTRQGLADEAFARARKGLPLTAKDRWSLSHAYVETDGKWVRDDTIRVDGMGSADLIDARAAIKRKTQGIYLNGRVNPSGGMLAVCDVWTPSLYTFYTGPNADGERAAAAKMCREHRLLHPRKPLLPYVWELFHDRSDQPLQPIPHGEFRAIVRAILENADGLVLFDYKPGRSEPYLAIIREEAARAALA
jgi:hypothetical protein